MRVAEPSRHFTLTLTTWDGARRMSEKSAVDLAIHRALDAARRGDSTHIGQTHSHTPPVHTPLAQAPLEQALHESVTLHCASEVQPDGSGGR